MHILLIADGRSPTTRTYLRALYELDMQVSMISTFPAEPPEGLRHFEIMPVALARLAGSQAAVKPAAQGATDGRSVLRRAASVVRRLAAPLRYFFGPLSIPFYRRRYLRALEAIRPDGVHALRIPYEGMLASLTPPDTPLLVTTWGNDLTLHAHGSPLMKHWTRKTLQRANGLVSDTRRDVRLAGEWGFSAGKPALVVPGSGGLDLAVIAQAAGNTAHLPEPLPDAVRQSSAASLVVNPRGFRPGSVRNDTFFKAIPLVLQHLPGTLFACCAMQGQPEALEWVDRLDIQNDVVLLPYLPQQDTWALFHAARVSTSISQHDGTPNSLLESMACGCFPIAGDIESLREWITPGENGLLVDPASPQQLADALILALTDAGLRSRAAEINREIVQTRAEKGVVQAQLAAFYRRVA